MGIWRVLVILRELVECYRAIRRGWNEGRADVKLRKQRAKFEEDNRGN